jgi:hypothetical protein
MIKKLFSTLTAQRQEDRDAELYRNLIRHEAKIGGQLFGPVPKDHRREFFCLDEHTWVWHEEWLDSQGIRHIKTTRYDIRPNGILKAQDGQNYQYVGDEEARHFYQATKLYFQRVRSEIYANV